MSSFIVALNNVFRRPNVGGRESETAYSEWEHHWGRQLVQEYLEPQGDLAGKYVLDVGCGLGGKTIAYEEGGAIAALGTDILVKNVRASRDYAREHSPHQKSAFFTSDAGSLPVADATFDTVVANDAMEHFSRPAEALAEMARVTRPGGAIWLFFTPHFSPLGSHLYDYVYTPWCHLLFTRGQLSNAVAKVLAERQPDASAESLDAQRQEIMRSYDEDLNHMNLRWFHRIVRELPTVRMTYRELRPAKYQLLKPFTRVPFVQELVTGFVIARLERTND